MILTKEVEVTMNGTNVMYWIKLGYPVPSYIDSKGRSKLFKRGSFLKVKVSDLPPLSNVRIQARCVVCSLEREVSFSCYSETCWACNLTSQRGAQHPRYLHRVKTGGTDRAFDLYLRRKYQISIETYFQIFTTQQYKCAVCFIPQANEGRRFAVDHDHKSLKVRGILCQPCNTALGLLKENEQSIINLMEYLGKKVA